MFNLIHQKQHNLYKPKIESFLEKWTTNSLMPLPLSEQNEVAYIVAEHKEFGVYGGAYLYRKKIKFLPSEIKQELEIYLSLEFPIWIGSVFLDLENPKIIHLAQKDKFFYVTFYRNLYEKLFEFGKNQGMGLICMKLKPEEYSRTKEISQWPYSVSIEPSKSPDHLFHGILSLMVYSREIYKRKW